MFTFLLIACAITLALALFTDLPRTIAKMAVETFTFGRVYVLTTAIAVISFSLLGFVTVAYAQDPTTEGGLLQYLLENWFTAKEAGTVAVALLVSKSLLFAFNTPTLGKLLDRLTGKVKLVVTFALTYVVGVLSVMVIKDLPLAAALFDSANIPLLGLLLNQIYKQFVVKASEPSKADQLYFK